MKKFLTDDLKIPQLISEEALLEIFKVPKAALKQITDEKLIVVYHCATKLYSVQVAYNSMKCNSNNTYLVFVYNKKEELIFHMGVTSYFPYVWEREFLAFRDLIHIQEEINKVLEQNKLPKIDFTET